MYLTNVITYVQSMEYLSEWIELVMEDFFANLKYAKKVLRCKGWIMERGNELRSIVLIKRRVQNGTKKFLFKIEQDINCLEDVYYLEKMLKDLDAYLSKIVHFHST